MKGSGIRPDPPLAGDGWDGDDPAGAGEVADALNEACRTVVAVARAGERGAIDALAARLDAQAARFAASGSSAVANFVSALAALLHGTPVGEASLRLQPPYRDALEAVAADIARPDEAARDVDWVAALAARVATLLQRRDRSGARELAGRLQELRAAPGLDPDIAAYFDVLLGVLAGEDVRAGVLGLVEPYRSAYLSLAAVVHGADPRAGLVERVRDNTTLVLAHGDGPARDGLAAALADVEAEAERGGEVDLARFIRAVGRLIDGGPAVEGELTGLTFDDPELEQAWRQICAAWALARAGSSAVAKP